MVYGELGRHKLIKLVESRMVTFWGRIVNGDGNKLSCMMYKYLRVLHDKGIYTSPWLLKIKSIFEKTGIPFIWNTPFSSTNGNNTHYCHNLNLPWLKITINRKLDDIYKQEWCVEVDSNTQCKIYRIFKMNLTFEKYLVKLPFRNRLSLCRLRCNNSKIPTVTGRYRNIVFHDRLCTLCDQEKLGDEFHYFFECKAFSQERKKYIPPYFRKNPNTLKMEDLFQTSNGKTLLKISLFCGEILRRFN